MLALDVSGSMSFQGCFGCEQITPAIASAALSMVTWNVEDNVEMVAFGGHLEKLEDYGLHKDMELREALSRMRRVREYFFFFVLLSLTWKKRNCHIYAVISSSSTSWIFNLIPCYYL